MTDASTFVSSNGSDDGVYPASTVRSPIRNHNNLVRHIDKLQDEAHQLHADNECMKAQLKDANEQCCPVGVQSNTNQGASKYGFYEFFKKTYSDIVGPEYATKYKTLIYIVGSASAEAIADIALGLFEAVKVRVQTQPGFSRGLSDGFPKITKAESVAGLFKGLEVRSSVGTTDSMLVRFAIIMFWRNLGWGVLAPNIVIIASDIHGIAFNKYLPSEGKTEELKGEIENRFFQFIELKDQEHALIEVQNNLLMEKERTELLEREVSSMDIENKKFDEMVMEYLKALEELESLRFKNGFFRRKVKKMSGSMRKRNLKIKAQEAELKGKENVIEEFVKVRKCK
ncbi:hypothetical protein L6452_09130 [Arctium lappa]|uniref:Uncharacterized protein n=1 Tax=Arctium lappa TaxID=4217 RepID=A0ACB9DJQ5_ARCLA|nr:hypothetical protein L6452_09130 [Arctium lappa]